MLNSQFRGMLTQMRTVRSHPRIWIRPRRKLAFISCIIPVQAGKSLLGYRCTPRHRVSLHYKRLLLHSVLFVKLRHLGECKAFQGCRFGCRRALLTRWRFKRVQQQIESLCPVRLLSNVENLMFHSIATRYSTHTFRFVYICVTV